MDADCWSKKSWSLIKISDLQSCTLANYHVAMFFVNVISITDIYELLNDNSVHSFGVIGWVGIRLRMRNDRIFLHVLLIH